VAAANTFGPFSKGEDIEIDFTIRVADDPSAAVVDITGWTFSFKVKRTDADADPSLTPGATVTIISPTAGTVKAVIPAVDSATLSGDYRHALWRTNVRRQSVSLERVTSQWSIRWSPDAVLRPSAVLGARRPRTLPEARPAGGPGHAWHGTGARLHASWAAYSRAFRKDHPTCGERADGTLDHVHSRCVQQGLTTPAECVDHTVPVTQGGAFWDPMNHMACCLACNTWKANTLEREHAS
jgi:hypothetical protein